VVVQVPPNPTALNILRIIEASSNSPTVPHGFPEAGDCDRPLESGFDRFGNPRRRPKTPIRHASPTAATRLPFRSTIYLCSLCESVVSISSCLRPSAFICGSSALHRALLTAFPYYRLTSDNFLTTQTVFRSGGEDAEPNILSMHLKQLEGFWIQVLPGQSRLRLRAG